MTSRNPTETRRPAWPVALLAGFAALASPVHAHDTYCSEHGLIEWDVWKSSVILLNPGIGARMLTPINRDRFLTARPCAGDQIRCPPDSVWVFYCFGKETILFGYEKNRCAVQAGEMPLPEYLSVVQDDLSCDLKD